MHDLDPVAFGKDMGDLVRSAVQPLKDKIAHLEKQLDEIQRTPGPQGEPGKDGKDGKDGADADPIEISQDDVLRALKSDPDFLREIVADYLKENPPKPGKDGRDGKDGIDGQKGADGKDGADGIGATGAMIDANGELIITLSNGTLQRCGVVVGRDGSPGRDGADLSDVDFEYDGERGITVKAKGGQVVRRYEMPVVIDKGYWRDGLSAKAGDAYTHDGSLWIALRETSTKPGVGSKSDWRLAVRKGRDGKPGKDGRLIEDKPVSVGGGSDA